MTTERRAGADDRGAAESLNTLAILLGPYRNLTTVTSAGLALHPSVQVLNHGAERLWRRADIDFIGCPEQAVYRRFLTAALQASANGRRGLYGGSILHSHAFEDRSLQLAYRRRYGNRWVKASATCLVWKESMLVQQRLSADDVLLPRIIENLPSVRFVLPVRQPIDCAVSNIATGLVGYLMSGRPQGMAEAIDAVVQAIAWVLTQRDRWPDRFFVFTEYIGSLELARGLTGYLDLPQDAEWLQDLQAIFRVRRKAPHSQNLLRIEREKIATLLAPWRDVRDSLLA